MVEEAIVAESLPWILPPSPRTRRSCWNLARFVFLASACAGFVFTSAITWLVEKRIDAAVDELRSEARRAEATKLRDSKKGVLSYRDEQGFHTRVCRIDAQTRHTSCAQAAK